MTTDGIETGAYRHTDPETSRDAAMDVNAGDLKDKVERRLASYGKDGATADQIAQDLGRKVVSVTPRFRPLEQENRILRTNNKRKSLSSNKMREVWITMGYATEEQKIEHRKRIANPKRTNADIEQYIRFLLNNHEGEVISEECLRKSQVDFRVNNSTKKIVEEKVEEKVEDDDPIWFLK